MGEADRLAIASGIPGIVLMENAGRAVAEAVARRDPPGSRVVVVAGPGNNGGDGFVAARLLAERRYRVSLLLVGSPDRLKGDAAEAARRWTGPVLPAAPEHLDGAGDAPHVVIDALFGAGLDRPVDGLPRAMIEAIGAAAGRGARIVAVDLPSGINGTTGAVMGAAVRADESVTFFRAKPGHWLLPGRLHRGRLTIAGIGIPDAVLDTVRPRCALVGPAFVRDMVPLPSLAGHKYSRGHVVVVSGGASTTGAARL
ncbi:NAD(P)H-hydrate epimerase, partial [Rhodoplanes roseus]